MNGLYGTPNLSCVPLYPEHPSLPSPSQQTHFSIPGTSSGSLEKGGKVSLCASVEYLVVCIRSYWSYFTCSLFFFIIISVFGWYSHLHHHSWNKTSFLRSLWLYCIRNELQNLLLHSPQQQQQTIAIHKSHTIQTLLFSTRRIATPVPYILPYVTIFFSDSFTKITHTHTPERLLDPDWLRVDPTIQQVEKNVCVCLCCHVLSFCTLCFNPNLYILSLPQLWRHGEHEGTCMNVVRARTVNV